MSASIIELMRKAWKQLNRVPVTLPGDRYHNVLVLEDRDVYNLEFYYTWLRHFDQKHGPLTTLYYIAERTPDTCLRIAKLMNIPAIELAVAFHSVQKVDAVLCFNEGQHAGLVAIARRHDIPVHFHNYYIGDIPYESSDTDEGACPVRPGSRGCVRNPEDDPLPGDERGNEIDHIERGTEESDPVQHIGAIMQDEIKEVFLKIAKQHFGVTYEDVDLTQPMHDQANHPLDSLDRVELIMHLEENLGKEFPDSTFQDAQGEWYETPQEWIDAVHRRMNNADKA